MKVQTLKSTYKGNLRLLYKSDQNVVKTVNSVVENFHKTAKSCGIPHAIKIHKEVERHCKMILLSQSSTLNHVLWLKMDGDFPKYLHIQKNRLDQPEYKRVMLTTLAYYRLFTQPVSDDISNITTPGPVISEKLLNEVEQFADQFWKSRGIKPFEPREDLFPAYATTKAGANGPSAMGLTSLKDIISLEKNNLYQKIISFSPRVYTNSEKLVQIMEDSLAIAKQSLEDFSSKGLFSSGRLHLLAEGGGKTRVICIPDVWTQSVLKPLHKYLMEHVLKRMPCDGSFGHEALGNKVKKFTKHRGLFCFDLTAATDRFPLEIQKAALKPLFGDLVHEWSDLLVNRNFTFKSKNIRYAVGQPMGLLTSWAAFSATHHVIINMMKNDKSFYAIIGDDVGISSREGATRYQNFMQEIGVSINDAKSLIPSHDNKVAEIAKRQFMEGKEISPIPPRVLLESTGSLEGLLEFLQVLANRTGKFKELSELELRGVRRIVRKNKEFDTDKFQVLLTCSLQQYNPFGEYLNLLAPIKNEVTPRWNESIPTMTYQGELDSWMLRSAVNMVNQNPLALSALGLGPSPRPSASQSSPLISSYLGLRRKVLEELFRRSEQRVTHEYGEENSHKEIPLTSIDVYNEILSGPDPLSPKDFMEKRRIRRKQAVDLLYRYYNQSRFARAKL